MTRIFNVSMNCPQCHTEPVKRRIPFGRVGAIEMEACDCEAMRLMRKYENTGKADNADDVEEHYGL